MKCIATFYMVDVLSMHINILGDGYKSGIQYSVWRDEIFRWNQPFHLKCEYDTWCTAGHTVESTFNPLRKFISFMIEIFDLEFFCDIRCNIPSNDRYREKCASLLLNPLFLELIRKVYGFDSHSVIWFSSSFLFEVSLNAVQYNWKLV